MRGEDELVSGVLVEWPQGKVQEVIGSSGLEASSEVWAGQRFGNRWVRPRQDADTRRRVTGEGPGGREDR